MTLDKAIENRTLYLKSGKIPKSSDDYNATLLSIEALDLISSHRKGCYMDPRKLLPGETKE